MLLPLDRQREKVLPLDGGERSYCRWTAEREKAWARWFHEQLGQTSTT
jgi:hypothetical protein